VYKLSRITVILIFILSVSCSSYVGLHEMQLGLDNLIGTNFNSNSRIWLKNWSKINETETHVELEQTFQTGCSYAILVNKNSDVIESWRFTSSKEQCEQKIYVPGV
jgi:hypothetical protein